ncbi:Pecanex-like protein 2 [Plecturocebus cupreus]
MCTLVTTTDTAGLLSPNAIPVPSPFCLNLSWAAATAATVCLPCEPHAHPACWVEWTRNVDIISTSFFPTFASSFLDLFHHSLTSFLVILKRFLEAGMVISIIYYMVTSPKLLSWIKNESLLKSLQPFAKWHYIERDLAIFNINIDDDYVPCLQGITRASFCNVYLEWIQHCARKRQENQSLTLPRLECNGTIIAHCSLKLLGSSDPPVLTSLVAGTQSMYHRAWLIFKKFFMEMGFAMLPRMILNSWAQVILPPWLPKVLGLQPSKILDSDEDSPLVTLSFALCTLGRRALGTAAHNMAISTMGCGPELRMLTGITLMSGSQPHLHTTQRLSQENCLNPEVRGCSEPRLRHCTQAWETERLHL